MTGHGPQDPYDDWLLFHYQGKSYPIMRRGALTLCLWWAALAVGGWILTEFLSA